MKKSIAWISVTLIIAVLSTSCGTKLPEAGDYTEAGSASGSGVSGSAVSDSVSGSAVNGVRKQKGTVKKRSLNDKYPYCNDKNLYKEGRNNKIVQCRLDGTVVREYKIKAGKDWYITYVNNEEIFYASNENKKDESELWRIPIDKRMDGDDLQIDKAAKILSGKAADFLELYVYKDYIAFFNLNDEYKEYDRKRKKFITVDRKSEDRYKQITLETDSPGYFYGMTGDTVFLQKTESGNWDAGTRGLYAHKLGTGTVTKITDWYERHGTGPAYWMDIAIVAGNKFYYDLPESGRETAEGYLKKDVWVYDIETKENRKFISSEQLDSHSPHIGGAGLVITSIFIDENKMYILAYEYIANAHDSILTVFSKNLDGNSTLQYEKKLSEFLNNMEYKDEDEDTVIIGEGDIDFLEGKAILEYGPDARKGCYNLADGTFKDVKKGDAAAAYWDYRNVMNGSTHPK